jgi:hypothetical protein
LQQGALRPIDPLIQALERGGATTGERDDVSAAIALVRDAVDQTIALELIEDRVKLAAVNPQPTPERGLARRPLLGERGEHGEVLPARALLSQRLVDQASGPARDFAATAGRVLSAVAARADAELAGP